jgi:hypothetical protein
MKIQQMSHALKVMRDKYGLDATDLELLGEFVHLENDVTIMFFVDYFSGASQATTHARIKKLCEKNILKKVEVADNLRYKTLEKGSEYNNLVKLLEKL